jgi:hypothetical protein
MKLTRKQKARIAQQIKAEREELDRFAKRLSRGSFTPSPSKPFGDIVTDPYFQRRLAESNQYKSKRVDYVPLEKPIRYEGEMAEREAVAQKEIERKKMQVAPMYSKGAYQYITEGTDLKTLGRKV